MSRPGFLGGFYAFLRLPEEYGGREISIRLFQNEEDDRRGTNPTEILRAIPDRSEEFARLNPLCLDECALEEPWAKHAPMPSPRRNPASGGPLDSSDGG